MTNTLIIGRKPENERILSAIENGGNVLISGPVYRGKTYLVQSIMEVLSENSVIPIYFNCMTGFSEKAFLELFSKQIIKKISVKLKNIFEESNKYLPNIRPKINMNSLHGVDIRIDYNINNKDISQYLSELIKVPTKIFDDTQQKIVVVFDEFQMVSQLTRINIKDLIRKSLGEGVSYIFVCSKQKETEQIIQKKDLKRMNIIDVIELETIPKEILFTYIENHLKNNHIKYTPNIIERLISVCSEEISFIRKILKIMIEKGLIFKRVSLMDISDSIREIVSSYEDIFFIFFNSLSEHQKNLIIAIANFGGQQIFKGDFIYQNGLVSVPSVQTSISALMKKNFVYKDDGGYKITDFFFKEWLMRKFI
ncbi:MAG: hypothetical protein A2Y40_04730 [Candidatus Margulisbacteria bacterium GWF2_35_9]|nr:MAG: hypothetical protein A2Y40_04730 [Candidatus Margulisbacteria bacterium GWF2_35_9]